jgi:hypothetical protein
MVSADVDTEAALEAVEFPVEAIVDCAAMRTALFEAALALDAAALVLALVSASDITLFKGRKTLLDRAKVGFAAEALIRIEFNVRLALRHRIAGEAGSPAIQTRLPRDQERQFLDDFGLDGAE